MGYSLVGVYPCAVWKPRSTEGQAGPARPDIVESQRTQPYHNPKHKESGSQKRKVSSSKKEVVQHQILQPQIIQPQVIQPQVIQQQIIQPQVIQPQVIQPQVIQPQVIQPQVIQPQVIQTQQSIGLSSCACSDASNTQKLPAQISNTTPMLFVPFNVPNFPPPITGSNVQSNIYSPSKVSFFIE